jgi:hypothetical protein
LDEDCDDYKPCSLREEAVAACEDEDEIAVCLKHSTKSGREYHYHQDCKSAADIEDLGPGDFLSKDNEIAACGCCLDHDFIVDDLLNSEIELKGKTSSEGGLCDLTII